MKVIALLILSLSAGLSAAQTKTIALTIDDLPYATLGPGLNDVDEAHRNITAILGTLKTHHAPAVAFVNEAKLQVSGQLDARVALLDLWLDGGVELGNHTYSHKNLNKTPLTEFEDEVIRGEVITRRLMKARAMEERYFRHPFLMTGADLDQRNAFESFLKSRNYIVAPVTTENLDWLYNTAYRYELQQHDQASADKVIDAYLAHTDYGMDYYEKMTRAEFGRDIAYVMLLHANQINALVLDKVLSKLEARGYRFVPLEEALKDPAYQTPDKYAGNYGYPWQHRWALALNQDQDLKGAPDPPKWVQEIYNTATKQ